ncbi:flagellar assembly protein FliH [Allohahella marinimesophila]|uniref:Flagellar assembly protein FliH n=1 Tax=Allohahella marinimesophila TaxID=1054972 RepID=A0ABP7PPC4_9GAMM
MSNGPYKPAATASHEPRDSAGERMPVERIPAESLTAYERWEMPAISEAGQMAKRREPPAPIKPPTAADLEAIREAAYQDGLAQGLEEGRKKGYESGFKSGYEKGKTQGRTDGMASGRTEIMAELRSQIDSGVSRLDQVVQVLASPVDALSDELEAASLSLVLAISRSVVARELTLDASHVADIVRYALTQLPESDKPLRIFVNPDDLAFLQEHARPQPEWLAQCVADPALAPGGCRLDNRTTLVDFSTDKRFAQVISDMLNRNPAAESADEDDAESDAADPDDADSDGLRSVEARDGETDD